MWWGLRKSGGGGGGGDGEIEGPRRDGRGRKGEGEGGTRNEMFYSVRPWPLMKGGLVNC